MARTLYYVASSIDGFIADADDGIDWLLQFGFETFDAHYQRFLAGIGAIVMGAATYEFLLADENQAWPYSEIPTWVVTHRDLPGIPDADITFFAGDIVQLDDATPRRSGRPRRVGRRRRIHRGTVRRSGLLDELQVTIMPILVGSDKRLLPVAHASRPLELVRTTPFGDGAVEHVYKLR